MSWPCHALITAARALVPFSRLGGADDMLAYHDLDDDVVVWHNSGQTVTAGDVRKARLTLATLDRALPGWRNIGESPIHAGAHTAYLRRYLGDGLYVVSDSIRIWLTAELGRDATDAIYVEPEVLTALVRFMNRSET